jgi:hypothetical protein
MTTDGHRSVGAPVAPVAAAALRAQPLLAALTAGYVAVFGVYALAAGNGRFLVYGPVTAALAGAVAAIHVHMRLTPGVLWALSLWGLAHMAGGLLPSPLAASEILYDVNVLWLVRYDKLVHACGMAAGTVACWQVLRAVVPPTAAGLRVACLMAWLASMGLGAVNELLEFLVTRLTADSHVGGFENTGWDLVANLLGSASATAWLYRRIPPPHR